MVKGDDRYMAYSKMFKEKIDFNSIEELVLRFGSNYDLGEEIRQLYWRLKEKEK